LPPAVRIAGSDSCLLGHTRLSLRLVYLAHFLTRVQMAPRDATY
jgi:hypothetical protein